jgi:hypothetical protein
VTAPPAWITPQDVALYLDLPEASVQGDDNLALATATVKDAVERRRSDLVAADGTFTPRDEVRGGSIMWAALVYQARNAPSGYTGYGDETALFDALGARRSEILRMVGWRRPVAY